MLPLPGPWHGHGYVDVTVKVAVNIHVGCWCLDPWTWRQTDVSSQTVFTNYLTRWWLLGCWAMGCLPSSALQAAAASTWCSEGRSAVPLFAAARCGQGLIWMCVVLVVSHTYTNFTNTSQNSNFKGRGSREKRNKRRGPTLFSALFSFFFFSVCWTSLVSVSCVLSHVHVLFGKLPFFSLFFIFFCQCVCVFCYVWAASVLKPKNVRRTTAQKGRQ